MIAGYTSVLWTGGYWDGSQFRWATTSTTNIVFMPGEPNDPENPDPAIVFWPPGNGLGDWALDASNCAISWPLCEAGW